MKNNVDWDSEATHRCVRRSVTTIAHEMKQLCSDNLIDPGIFPFTDTLWEVIEPDIARCAPDSLYQVER